MVDNALHRVFSVQMLPSLDVAWILTNGIDFVICKNTVRHSTNRYSRSPYSTSPRFDRETGYGHIMVRSRRRELMRELINYFGYTGSGLALLTWTCARFCRWMSRPSRT